MRSPLDIFVVRRHGTLFDTQEHENSSNVVVVDLYSAVIELVIDLGNGADFVVKYILGAAGSCGQAIERTSRENGIYEWCTCRAQDAP